jgi:hypothetical protein
MDVKPIENSDTTFYFYDVKDVRENRKFIAVIQKGAFSKKFPTKFVDGIEYNLYQFLKKSHKQSQSKIPLMLRIRSLNFAYNDTGDYPSTLYASFDFVHNDSIIYNFTKVNKYTYIPNEDDIPLLIRNVLAEALEDLKVNIDFAKLDTIETNKNKIADRTQKLKKKELASKPSASRSNVTLGYGIGGINLIGINITARLNDVLGLHFGIGYVGFTTGIKIHFFTTKYSGFLNLSLKDGGFGAIKMLGAEFGKPILLSKAHDISIFFQVGVGFVIDKSDDFDSFFLRETGSEIPNTMLTYGIGLSF